MLLLILLFTVGEKIPKDICNKSYLLLEDQAIITSDCKL